MYKEYRIMKASQQLSIYKCQFTLVSFPLSDRYLTWPGLLFFVVQSPFFTLLLRPPAREDVLTDDNRHLSRYKQTLIYFLCVVVSLKKHVLSVDSAVHRSICRSVKHLRKPQNSYISPLKALRARFQSKTIACLTGHSVARLVRSVIPFTPSTGLRLVRSLTTFTGLLAHFAPSLVGRLK